MNPYSSLKVSFWMMTDNVEGDASDTKNYPAIEAGVAQGSHLQHYNDDYLYAEGDNNSQERNEYYSAGTGVFQNSTLKKWEKMEFTFAMDGSHYVADTEDMDHLYFFIQWTNANLWQEDGVTKNTNHGEIFLDDMSVLRPSL